MTASVAKSTQVAQATCKLGIEAYSFACWATEEVASQEPQVPDPATMSTKPLPGRSLGGATGTTRNSTSATRLITNRELRSRR